MFLAQVISLPCDITHVSSYIVATANILLPLFDIFSFRPSFPVMGITKQNLSFSEMILRIFFLWVHALKIV
jgi:hypothetical protein